jgi:DNA-binding beta-propeller fold protein YncE
VHVADLYTNTLLTTIEGFFAGVFAKGTLLEAPGPGGLIVVTANNELWVGDADGIVAVVDLFTHKVVASISNGATYRADEFANDPESNTVVVSSDFDVPLLELQLEGSILSVTPKNRTVLRTAG